MAAWHGRKTYTYEHNFLFVLVFYFPAEKNSKYSLTNVQNLLAQVIEIDDL